MAASSNQRVAALLDEKSVFEDEVDKLASAVKYRNDLPARRTHLTSPTNRQAIAGQLMYGGDAAARVAGRKDRHG